MTVLKQSGLESVATFVVDHTYRVKRVLYLISGITLLPAESFVGKIVNTASIRAAAVQKDPSARYLPAHTLRF